MKVSISSSTSRRAAIVAGLLAGVVLMLVSAGALAARGWLGVIMKRGPLGGVVVRDVVPTSPAAKAGLRVDDMLLRANGRILARPRDLGAIVSKRGPGQRLSLTIRRSGKESTLHVVLAAYPGREAVMRRRWVGQKAPSLVGLKWLDAKAQPTLKSLRGRVVLLDFFANWCGICRLMAPKLSGLHRRFGARGLTLLGVAGNPHAATVQVKKEWKLPYALASDVRQASARRFHVYALPQLFLIDQKGIIRDVLIGYNPQGLAKLEERIRALVGKK